MEAESGQSNRLFIIIAVAMIGLICIGLVGLGGVGFFIFNNRAQEAAVVPPTFTPILPTFTPTYVPTPTATNTPLPTPLATMVVAGQPGPDEAIAAPTADEVAPDAEVTPTNTRVVPLDTPVPVVEIEDNEDVEVAMPGSGGVLSVEQGVLAWAGIGVLILLVIGVVNYYRPVF
jgi:hypothetical protein